ncbi:hypothetical protein [Calothrix rhizosoleniae]|uniref:hypothetical protein n=1 Tax=Calothrix rhizosoleniae TaxID=888997 RepID=UPI001F348D1A|nr:hypothetical protein [Calothrix rhizosoleniae]
MSKQKQSNLGESILTALTQQEISQLLDVLFSALTVEERERALVQLPTNTQQTLQQILTPQPQVKQTKTKQSPPVSLAKLAQTWSQLWQEWNEIVWEASQEEGKYIVQEVDWEPPYFDNYTIVEDLEKVAQKIQPLVETAFEHGFTPDESFTSVFLEMESDISGGIPDWMDIDDGIHLEEHITTCFLQWEWLVAENQGQNAFKFAQKIRGWEEEFSLITLDDDAVVDFFTQLPETQQRCLLTEFTANRENPQWKTTLDNTHSPWHHIYMDAINQYAPERYLVNLRATIPQQWQNGLPVIEDLLAQQDYSQSLTVIQETLDSLLQSKRLDNPWTPETSLLFTVVSGFNYSNQGWENETTLLRYYQQTAEGLGESERVKVLEIQQIAFVHSYDWSTMFQTFTEINVTENTRQALFQSWRNHIIRYSKPHSYYSGLYTKVKTVDMWWLHWLIDSIAEPDKGKTWFQSQITQWLTNLPEDRVDLGEEYNLLRLLTKDLTEICAEPQNPCPRFYQVVIRPKDLSAADDKSRQMYLHEYAPDDLWERVMSYWREHLHNFVPKPELAQKSDYTEHAQWIAALKELNSDSYEILLKQWQVDHQRRRNLWKAMDKLGLG